jgi:hypothetical protein
MITIEKRTTPHTAVILIEAAQGHVKKAQGLVIRALKAAGIPYNTYDYHSIKTLKMDIPKSEHEFISPRYTIEMTDDQMEQFHKCVSELRVKEGWSRSPLDIYHD